MLSSASPSGPLKVNVGFRIDDLAAGHRLGQSVAEVQFSDAVGAIDPAGVNVDTADRLLEVDLWKLDFSPLRQGPAEHEMVPLLSNPSPSADHESSIPAT